MSAFVVSTVTIDKCVAAIIGLKGDLHYARTPLIRDLARDPQALGAALYALNARQVAQCYPGDEAMARVPSWRYAEGKTVRPVDGLVALDCLEYQCSEGDCADQPLYLELRMLAGFMARRILRETPAWRAAPWDR